jgi:hypothetical protein
VTIEKFAIQKQVFFEMFICFATPENQYNTYFNRLAACFTRGPFCHVAVVFELTQSDGSIRYEECSINRSGNFKKDVVTLSQVENFEGWTCFRLELEDPNCELEAYRWVATSLVGEHYDTRGSIVDVAFCCCLPGGYRTITRTDGGNERTYCSRLAVDILKKVGQIDQRAPSNVSPNDIFKLFNNSRTKNKWTDVSKHVKEIFYTPRHVVQPVVCFFSENPGYRGPMLF